jgi:hypothetical protein
MLVLAMAAALAGQEPTRQDVTRGIDEVVARLARKPPLPIVVRDVVGCYPATGEHKGQFICLVDVNGTDGEYRVQQLPFVRDGRAWRMVEPSMSRSPACPAASEAESLFKARLGDGARVTDVPEDGTFTDERGKNRDKHGPMRLMCTYEVTRSLGPATVVAYFTYRDGKYGLDPDFETWW